MNENKMEKEEIPPKLLSVIAEHLKLSETEKGSCQQKLDELTKIFLTSESTVYCEDCGLVFFYGKAQPIASEKRFVDWKMLSFRHAWDTKHKVKIHLPFFTANAAMLARKSSSAFTFWNYAKHSLDFDDNNEVEYYLEVEKLRDRLEGTPQGDKKNDENWDANSTCFCSICGKEYYDPKRACLCHSEMKPWLPMKEVESIRVRRLR